MKHVLSSLFTCLLLAATALAQQAKARLDIHLNKNILQPGDSLFVTVAYKNDGGKSPLPLATLELIVENEQGLRTRLRWPVINGQASGTLSLPDSLPRGKYTLLAGLQDRFFEVIGKIQDAEHSGGSIQAMLLTKTGDWDEQEVPVEADGSFTVRNWLFEDNAVMAFSQTKASNQPLDIRISTQLDSTAKPFAVAGRAFYIGTPPPAVRPTLNKSIEAPEIIFADQGALLPAVVIKTTAKSPAQQFNEAYSTGLFRAGDERLLSIMDNPSALAFPTVFSYLQGRVAGLQISPAGFDGGMATWRGGAVSFFMDEVRVSPQQIASISMADIAIVKAYPPPFFGAPGGGAGGAIAVYTRRGGEAAYLPANKHVFRVRGYTPSSTVLNMNKLNL